MNDPVLTSSRQQNLEAIDKPLHRILPEANIVSSNCLVRHLSQLSTVRQLYVIFRVMQRAEVKCNPAVTVEQSGSSTKLGQKCNNACLASPSP